MTISYCYLTKIATKPKSSLITANGVLTRGPLSFQALLSISGWGIETDEMLKNPQDPYLQTVQVTAHSAR